MVEDRSCCLYHDNDCIEECLKFCFKLRLRDELHREAGLWNLHRIRPLTNLKPPSGRPHVPFFFPEVSGIRNYTVDVDLDELYLAEERCCYRPPQSGCSDELTQLSEIMRGKKFIISSHTRRGNNFVCHLTRRNRKNVRDLGHA